MYTIQIYIMLSCKYLFTAYLLTTTSELSSEEKFRKVIFTIITAQKMKFFIKDFFSKCDQIRSFLRIWSHLLKKSLMKTSFFVQSITEIHLGIFQISLTCICEIWPLNFFPKNSIINFISYIL